MEIDTVNEILIDIDDSKRVDVSNINFDNLQFGRTIADLMFEMDYIDGKWQNQTIKNYGNISISPATTSLHYGQALFEGLKVFRRDNKIFTFRIKDNLERLNYSARRLCMKEIDINKVESYIEKLIVMLKDWIPENEGYSLYIRPFMFASDAYVGIKESENYKFIVFCSTVGKYYSNPLKLKVETHYTRAVKGGVGMAKAAGNYAAALYPTLMAKNEGFDQLIWTDGIEHKYIEECGTMNIGFIINNKFVTPELSGSILSGLTRDSFIQIAKKLGIEVEERRISVDELMLAGKDGSLTEAFGMGTAATFIKIKSIYTDNDFIEIGEIIEEKSIAKKIGDYMTKLKTNEAEDCWNWIKVINCNN